MQATSVKTLMEIQTKKSEVAILKERVFTQAVNEHLDGIFQFARYMLSDPEEAQDIAQKTFLKFYDNFEKLDRGASVKPWLFTVARNLCLDFLKKKKALPFSRISDEALEIPDEDPSLESRVGDSMFENRVKGLIESLPVLMKEVVLLKYFEDLTFEQIAENLNQPVNTVKSNFYRGKTKLYDLLKKDSESFTFPNS